LAISDRICGYLHRQRELVAKDVTNKEKIEDFDLNERINMCVCGKGGDCGGPEVEMGNWHANRLFRPPSRVDFRWSFETRDLSVRIVR
jgi:hypothetical protein